MKKRKLIALVLALIICLSAVVPAFAAIKEPDAEIRISYCQLNGHTYVIKYDVVEDYYTMIDNNKCGRRLMNRTTCEKCDYQKDEYTGNFYNGGVAHLRYTASASCDGYTQYIVECCSRDGCTLMDTQTAQCPAAGHLPGACNRLPG